MNSNLFIFLGLIILWTILIVDWRHSYEQSLIITQKIIDKLLEIWKNIATWDCPLACTLGVNFFWLLQKVISSDHKCSQNWMSIFQSEKLIGNDIYVKIIQMDDGIQLVVDAERKGKNLKFLSDNSTKMEEVFSLKVPCNF